MEVLYIALIQAMLPCIVPLGEEGVNAIIDWIETVSSQQPVSPNLQNAILLEAQALEQDQQALQGDSPDSNLLALSNAISAIKLAS